MDKTMGFKIRDGKLKFVARTAEEQRRYREYFAEADKPKQRIPKTKKAFVMVPLDDLGKLIPLMSRHPTLAVYFVCKRQSFLHRGGFVLPSDQLRDIGGLSLQAQRRAIRDLERKGMISVERRHRKPPVIQIL